MKPQLDVLRHLTPAQLQAEIAYGEKMLSERHLYEFVKLMWPTVEPARDFVDGWTVQAICEHLEAVTSGEIKRLLINIPPGFMKSLLTDVFWPAWEWGPRKTPSWRYLTFSYSQSLTIRDNIRFRRVIMSETYRRLWGNIFAPSEDQFNTIRVANDKTGWKLASSVGGVGTGERGDRIIVDDPNSVQEAESEAVRTSTNTWFREVLPDRLNDMSEGTIVVIQQRTHEEDVSGVILAEELGYEHLCIPMEFDTRRLTSTSIGWSDPRTYDGELAWDERFPEEVIYGLKVSKGEYAYAGQYQQSPTPRGGGILKRDWWKLYPEEGEEFDAAGRPVKPLSFPPMEYIVAAADTALTTKSENDYSALVVMGVWRDKADVPRIMLMDAWKDRLTFHDLVERIVKTCGDRKVDRLLIEAKANGHSVAQEIARICGAEQFGVSLLDPKGADKVARVHSISHLLENGLCYAPDRRYAQMVVDECAIFPRGAHDDLVDATVYCLKHLRDSHVIMTPNEFSTWATDRLAPPKRKEIPYDV